MWKRCKEKRGLYGKKDISVCDSWIKFSNFLKDMGERPDGKTLDRIDNDGDYTPKNCRWVTPKENSNNRGDNAWITFNGETLTQAQWADRLGFDRWTIKNRFRMGWSVEKTLSTPVNETRWHLITSNGVTLPIADWARQTGIGKSTIEHRLKRGWTEHDAVTVRPVTQKRWLK